MKLATKSGAAIAAAAASLFLAGAVMTPVAHAAGAGKCMGANACKGKSACKTAKNACKGQNACKGTGFTQAQAADCKAAGGTYQPG